MSTPASQETIDQIFNAVQYGDFADLKKLLKEGADPNAYGLAGWTPLFYAKNAMRAELLIAAGAEPNARAADGKTALHRAACSGNANLVEALLAAGADPNIADHKGVTPLIEAAFNDHAGSKVIALLKGGANPNVQENDNGQTPLHGAAQQGPWNNVEALLKAGANPSVSDKFGATPVDLAVKFPSTQAALKSAALEASLPAAAPTQPRRF